MDFNKSQIIYDHNKIWWIKRFYLMNYKMKISFVISNVLYLWEHIIKNNSQTVASTGSNSYEEII